MFKLKFSDPHIFEKIKKGDDNAFSLLFDESYTALCFFANKYLADMDSSRSLVQQVFVDLWIKREKLNVLSSPESYLYNAVKNRSIDYLRKEKRTVAMAEPHENLNPMPFHDLMEEAELNDRINSAIQKLPKKCRQIFILCRFEGLKYAEIAKELNISVKTVEMQMGIALKRIRKVLSDYQMINLWIFILAKKS